MKICLLTYDTPHKKTAQVFGTLINRGVKKIDLMLMPFTRRPERSVALIHRPFQFEGPDPRSLVKSCGGLIIDYNDWRTVFDNYDYFLVCGSNLIDKDFATCGKIMNLHAGLIPISRGLDSFKWAILQSKKIGNTLHIINDKADSGKVIYQLATELYLEDDVHTFAERHYNNEIWMLSNFDQLIENPTIIIDQSEVAEPSMRMPIETEAEMLREFDTYKEMFAVNQRCH